MLLSVCPLFAAAEGPSPQELARQRHNPFTESITLPLQLSTSLHVGPGNGTAEGMAIQPVVPASVGEHWRVLARTSLPIVRNPPPEGRLGFGDFRMETYLTPARAGKWIWGAGPVFQVPTATHSTLGAGKWSAGPGAGLVFTSGPWVNGVLFNHVWSFAGDRDRPPLSLTSLEPVLSYNFEDGWFVSCDIATSVDWHAASGNKWSVPLGADFGKAFLLGRRSMSGQLGAYYSVLRQEGATDWAVRAQVSSLFPRRSSK